MSGPLVDWAQLLDPEVISRCPPKQRPLVFSALARGCQPYLLALLTHQSDWDTLHASIEALLNQDMPG